MLPGDFTVSEGHGHPLRASVTRQFRVLIRWRNRPGQSDSETSIRWRNRPGRSENGNRIDSSAF